MKLIELIKNLFKHHKINTNAELVRPLDIVKIPKRKEFNNDTLVDYYKNEYSSILSTMKDYDTLILEADELNNHIKMTIDLLFYISIKEAGIKEKSVEDRINYLINSEKLDLYKNDINTLQNEVIGRLLAISEIRKELFLSKKKKEAIDNVIDRLCLSLNTLYSIEVSIITNIERYKNESKYNSEPSKEEKVKEYEVINEKIKHLNWLQQILDNDSQINIRTDVNYILKDLALIEKKLEEYTYIHKVEITDESKNEEINKILEIPFDIEHKDELLKIIEQIERKYRTFYEYREYQEYGDIAIDESNLTNIYNLKFSALTISQDGIVEPFVNKVTDKLEIEYYQNIIFSMVQNIIMGKNEYFNELFKGDLEESISLLIDGLKYGNNEINYEEILGDKYLLNLLLALDKGELSNFYNNFKVKVGSYYSTSDKAAYLYGIFCFTPTIPLKTFFFFKSFLTLDFLSDKFNKIEDMSKIQDLFNDFYELYLTKIPKDENKYYLPEGIREINKIDISKDNYVIKLLNLVEENANGKVVYLPSTLESMRGELFNKDCQVKEIILNEGLQELLYNVFYNQTFDSITIPSTIERIGSRVFYFGTLKNMTFNNISPSKFITLGDEMFTNNFNRKKDVNYSELDNIIFHYDDLDMDIEISLSSFKAFSYSYLINSFYAFVFQQIYDKLIERLKILKAMLQIFKINIYEESFGSWRFNEYMIRTDGVIKLNNLLAKVIETENVLNKFITDNYDKYKEKADDLKHQLYLLSTKNFSYENKDELLKDIDDMVIKFKNNNRIPFNFNTSIVPVKYKEKYLSKIANMVLTNENFENLYNLKYSTLKLSENGLSEIFYDRIEDEEEKEYYKKVIYSQIDKLLKTVLPKLEALSTEEYNKVLKIFRHLFTTEKGYKCEEVLSDYFLFNFLNALMSDSLARKIVITKYEYLNKLTKLFTDPGSKLNHLFNNIASSTDLIISDEGLNERGAFTYDKNLFTLESALLFKYFKVYKGSIKFKHKESIINIPDDLAEFYYLYYKYYIKDDTYGFCLPEGITEINNMNLSYRDSELVEYFKENAYGKTLRTPKSLKRINCHIKIPFEEVYLNEGLEAIKNNAFFDQKIESLILPTTIKEIDDNVFNTKDLQTIIIKEDALIENGEEYLQEILKVYSLIERNSTHFDYHIMKLNLYNIKILLNNGEEIEYKIKDFMDDNIYPQEYIKLDYSNKNLCIHLIYEDLMEKIRGKSRGKNKTTE